MTYFDQSAKCEEEVSTVLHDHYRSTFLKHGANCKGVDWGSEESKATLRQEMMLNVLRSGSDNASLLDVGCGYGALLDVIERQQLNISYTGIDIVEEMVREGKVLHPNHQFISGDFMKLNPGQFDYVVCNGVLTQKLSITSDKMDVFAESLIKQMFSLCKIGVAFNMMTTHVNYQSENLFYKNPADLLTWCVSEVSPHVRIDNSYPIWYEFTTYLYKNIAAG